MKFREMNVTPKLAAKWLEKNASNRSLSSQRVDSYQRDMDAGRWYLNPHGIVFNAKGDLLDGQHRLSAIVQHDKPVRMVVASGANHDIRKYIDRLRARTVADALKMDGESAYVQKASITRWLSVLDGHLSPRDVQTTTDSVAALERYKAEFKWFETLQQKNRFNRCPYLAAVMWARPIDPVAIERFHLEVQGGAGIAEGSASLALRSNFIALSLKKGMTESGRETALRTLNGLEAFLAHRKVRHLYASAVGYRKLAALKGVEANDVLAETRIRAA
jgi:hypothetical protein